VYDTVTVSTYVDVRDHTSPWRYGHGLDATAVTVDPRERLRLQVDNDDLRRLACGSVVLDARRETSRKDVPSVGGHVQRVAPPSQRHAASGGGQIAGSIPLRMTPRSKVTAHIDDRLDHG
jgi:hypothetical protein